MLASLIGGERPLHWVLGFWPVLAAAFISAVAATALCRLIALRLGIVDRPDDAVKTHARPVAYLGGVGMLVGLAVGIVTGVCLCRADAAFQEELRWLLGVLAGASIACFVGLADDLLNLRPHRKLLGQVLAAAALLLVGIDPNLQRAVEPFGLTIPSQVEMVPNALIVTFFVVGATSSLNLLDGLDGLCAGVTAIIAAALLLLAVHLATWRFSDSGDPVRIIICLSLVGGLCGFLPFNRHPARIFMGDAGTMLLGFVVAALMIMFAEGTLRWWLASVVIFGLPILDTAVAVLRRWANRRPLYVPDRNHIYDRMMGRGLSRQRTIAVCYGLAGVYAFVGLAMSQIRVRYALVVYILVFTGSGLVVWRTGYLKMRGPGGVPPSADAEGC